MAMKSLRNNAGFTLVEILMVALVVGIVILASFQANVHFIKNMFLIEKKAEVASETQDLLMYLRRSSKNLTERRINRPETFLLAPNSKPIALGANLKDPVKAFTIDTAAWLSGGGASPLYSKAQSAATSPQMDVMLNSFNLEEHGLKNVAGILVKTTKRMMVSRCERIENYFTVGEGENKHPSVTALYVLKGLSRVPFISYDSAGKPELRCCPISSPQCADGEMLKHFFRSYAISFDNKGAVADVEEFPKHAKINPVFGGGFGLYFGNAQGTNVNIVSFTLINQCRTVANIRSPACELSELPAFLKEVENDRNIIKMDFRSISTTLSKEIANTGVISL